MAESLVIDRRANEVVVARLNRPERLNALSAELMDRLASLWRELARDEQVRCVVLTGSGAGFCSGADAEFLTADRVPRGAGLDEELAFVPARVVEVPVVVAVNGVCAGGGLHFVADADIVLASRSASFTDPHVSAGQVSGIEPISLALRLPIPVIMRMALLGASERLSAQRAYELGLVTELVEDDELLPRAIAIADVLAGSSQATVRATRRALRRLSDRLLTPYMDEGWTDVQRHWAHPDANEGPRAFAERRTPQWQLSPTPPRKRES